MNKIIYGLLVVTMSLLLSACGSNSKKDPIAPVVQGAQNTSFSFSDTDNELLIEAHREYSIGFKLNKDGYGFSGADVRMRSFDAKYGTIKEEQVKTDKNGRGVFLFIPPEKFPAAGKSVTIQYVFLVPLDDGTKQELIQNATLKFNFKGEGQGEKSKYYFSNVDTVITVEARQKYDIKFKLNKDGFGFAGGEVKVKSFNSKYGTIENEALTTDANGVGVFIYNPPADMPKKGVTTQIEFVFVIPSEDDKKEQISQKVTLKFNLKDDTPKGEDNYFFNETINIINVTSYKQYAIPLKLNKNNFAEAGATIKMKTFDSKFGTIEKPTVVTDENGRAEFVYNPPEKMPSKGTVYTIKFVYQIILANGDIKELEHAVDLKFNYDENENGDGKTSQLSITYLTTECDKKLGIVEHYRVHAVDTYSRKPIVGAKLSFSVINGVKSIHSPKIQQSTGILKNTKPISFKDSQTSFNGKVSADDLLIILPTQGKSALNYLGGWSIDDVSSALQLHGNYTNIDNVSGLTYIIGNEKRLLGGDNGSSGILASVHASAVNSVTNEEGFAYFDLYVDPIMGGHTVTVEAHGNDNNVRFGSAQAEFLRTSNFTAADVIVPNSGNSGLVAISPRIIPGCVGDQPLIDVPTGNYTFEPSDHCFMDPSQSNYHTDGNGNTYIYVMTDGNITATKKCTLHWKGGSVSVGHEY